MAYFFTPPVTTTTPRSYPGQRNHRLLRHFAPYQRSETVYIYDGVATTVPPPTAETVTRVFAGGHLMEPVTAAEKTILEAAGYSVEEV